MGFCIFVRATKNCKKRKRKKKIMIRLIFLDYQVFRVRTFQWSFPNFFIGYSHPKGCIVQDVPFTPSLTGDVDPMQTCIDPTQSCEEAKVYPGQNILSHLHLSQSPKNK